MMTRQQFTEAADCLAEAISGRILRGDEILCLS
jgi:hypothetical protein